MKPAKRIFFFVAFLYGCFLSPQIVKAQWWGHVDSLKLLPLNPTNTDTAKIICYATLGNSDCWLDSPSVSINDFEIRISVCYDMGIENIICHTIDSIIIGKLNSGSYQLIYNARFCNDTSAAPPDTLNFTILMTDIVSDSKSNLQLELSHNHIATDELTFTYNVLTEAGTVTIYNTDGKVVAAGSGSSSKQASASSNATLHLKLPELSRGIYFVVLQSGERRITGKFAKQ